MTTDLTLTLAQLISSDGRAHLLDSANRSTAGAVSLETAVASGQAFWVTPKATLLVLDEDRIGVSEDDTRRAAAFDTLVAAASACDVPHVVVDSGRPLNRHLFLVMGPSKASRLQGILLGEWARARGLDVREQGIRPPGSPHRLTGAAPASPVRGMAHAAQELARYTCASATAAMAKAVMGRGLSPRMLRLALSEDGVDGNPSKSTSESRMSLAASLVSVGSTRGALGRMLRWQELTLGSTLRLKPPAWQVQEVGRLWTKAEDYIRTGDGGREAARVSAWAEASLQVPCIGRTGFTDRAVLSAFRDLARRLNRTQVAFALGDIALAAGVTDKTARRAVRRLQAAGWLVVAVPPGPTNASVYRLTIPAGHVDREVPELHDSSMSDTGADFGRRGALGKATTAVGQLLAGRLAGAADIARWLGVKVTTARYHLRKLLKEGLARRDENGSWALTATTVDLHALAVARKTVGARAHQTAMLKLRRVQRQQSRELFILEKAAEREQQRQQSRAVSTLPEATERRRC